MKIWDSVYISLAHPLEQQFFPLSLYLLLFVSNLCLFVSCSFLSLLFKSFYHFSSCLYFIFTSFCSFFILFSLPNVILFLYIFCRFTLDTMWRGQIHQNGFWQAKMILEGQIFCQFFVIFWEWSSITWHVVKCRWTFSGMRFAKSVWSIYTLICLNTWVVYMCLFFTACSMK